MRKTFWAVLVGLLLYSLPAFPQKAPECVKNGIKYGVISGAFRAEWWNYQERGMSYIDGQCYAPALDDITKAIELRQKLVKKDCDQRRARTYGMHFVDYFGHRERGVALYRLGKLDEAQQELEASLNCVESSKAQFFLDQLRKNKIESGQLDKTPPEVQVSEPANKSFTNSSTVKVTGKASDDSLVKEIWVGQDAVVIPVAQKEISFSEPEELNPGWNNFKIRAVDITGKEKSADWSIYLDLEGPEVSIADIKSVSGAEVEVSGELADASPISKFVLNNKEIPLEAGRSFKARLPVAPEWKIFFKAVDQAGNVTEGVINLATEPKGAMLEKRRAVQEASLDGDWGYPGYAFQNYQMPFSFQMNDSGKALAQLAFTELYWNLKEKVDTYTDKEPPVIKLRGFKNETTVYFPELYLEGLVSDASNLKEVTINNKNLLGSQRKNMFFNYIVPLAPGLNRIVIRAVDVNGNVAERPIRVNRIVPVVHQLNERMVVSMLPFYQMGQVKEIGGVGYDNLITAIVNQKRFNFVDRSKIEAIVRELQLSAEQLVDPEYTLKVGKMTQSEGMIQGYVKETPSAIEIYAQLVDVESGEVLTEKDAYKEDKSLDAVKFITRGLAIRLREDFPVLEGKVVSLDGKKISIDLGSGQKIKPGMRLIFFTEEQMKDPESGVSLGVTTQKLGTGKVVEVRDRMSMAETVGKTETISPEKRVITK
jgi:hypothetical protein